MGKRGLVGWRGGRGVCIEENLRGRNEKKLWIGLDRRIRRVGWMNKNRKYNKYPPPLPQLTPHPPIAGAHLRAKVPRPMFRSI